MKKLKGESIKFNLENYTKIEDLIFYDGPILSSFMDKNNIFHLCLWVDFDKIKNRWMFFNTSRYLLNQYLKGKISLDRIVKANISVYFLDIKEDFKNIDGKIVFKENIPSDYMPEDSYFYTSKTTSPTP